MTANPFAIGSRVQWPYMGSTGTVTAEIRAAGVVWVHFDGWICPQMIGTAALLPLQRDNVVVFPSRCASRSSPEGAA